MLSPHEMAALMLLDTNPFRGDLDLRDLDALSERQLVLLQALAFGDSHPCVTEQGRALLRMIGRLH